MRRLPLWIMTFLLGLLMTANIPKAAAQNGYYSATYQDFYDGLAPYGQWIQDPRYGYVWLPDVDQDFRPYYTNGYWANTEYGNTWISDYEWGWAPFHYGRWTYDNYYGWLWIPDTQWAPAWVSWRSTNDYYGWAPMGPGVNINVNLGLIPVDWWVFLSPNYFYDRSFYRYCNNDYRFRRNLYTQSNFISYTYIDNRTTYYTGPRSDDYYRSTGRRPSMFRISNDRKPGATRVSGNRVNIYRPKMSNPENAAPARLAKADRSIATRPQTFKGSAQGARGRELVLRQTPLENNSAHRAGTGTTLHQETNNSQERSTIPATGQNRSIQNSGVQPQAGQRPVNLPAQRQNIQETQQRDLQQQQRVQQQVQQQRDAQQQQQRMQQQAQQQRDAQQQQQRTAPVQQNQQQRLGERGMR